MPRELKLFLKENLTFEEKFYKLMDILISIQPDSRFETFFFMIINYLQILSLFYAKQIKVFNPENSKTDSVLYIIEKIVRFKDLFRNNYPYFEFFLYFLFIFFLLRIIFFLIICLKSNNTSIYSINKRLINYFIKTFLYVEFNIILDLSFSNFCFGFVENNPNFDEEIKCVGNSKILIIITSIIFILISFSVKIILQLYYNDSFFLSKSFYIKMLTHYEIIMDLNYLFNSILLTQAYFLTKEFFLIYNLFAGIFLCFYYIRHYIYYDEYINLLAGIFHSIYAWTCIFSIIFAYIDFNEKGIIYIISSIIIGFSYFNIKNKIENDIFYNTPLTRFENINYLLYYLKVFTEKIIKYDEKNENKAFISGVIQVLIEENPHSRYQELIKGDIYLPLENKWRDPKKRDVDDKVFLKYFVVLLFDFLLYNNYSFPEIYFNLSMYYLKIMCNYCEAMYYYQKIFELKLNIKQRFTFTRLKLKISEALIEKLKPSNEQNVNLENVNISMYYKYDSLSHDFIEEINKDIELSLEFWKIFKRSLKETSFKINFNKVFKLTEKIQITKNNIDKMWSELFQIYNGINEYFEFYNQYIDQINDDDLKKRDLDSIKKKAVNFNEYLSHNYYSILFNKDTGIMIVNADKGSEGIIKQYNKRIELIFNYNNSDLKDINVNKLMPKLYDKKHSNYIERYFRIGYKKYIEIKDFKTFAKDKNNAIIQIKMALKLLPILNYNVFFTSLILKDNINDIILIDENFIIQGMSSKLMEILNINNIYLFQENNIPFYVICKKFINFYSIFLGNKKKDLSHTILVPKRTIVSEKEKIDNLKRFEEKEMLVRKDEEDSDKDEIHENLEINENIELEFEIKIPLFLINYSNKKNYKVLSHMEKTLSMNSHNQEKMNSEEEDIEFDDEYEDENDINNDNENELLVKGVTNRNNPLGSFYINNFGSNEDNTPTPTPLSPKWNDSKRKNSLEIRNMMNKKNEEENIFLEKIDEYKTLFNEQKFEELEDLIDLCNKDSPLSEYKFNFTFDIYKFGDNETSYIVRCIDNRDQEGLSEEKSIELDSKAVKYKKKKAESIKPLFELLEEERQEILNLPEKFLKLSSDNIKFQELLDVCKNEIINMSKTQGQKKDEVLEDENSSQSSHTGFDSGLVKKNRIQEIRSNLFKNVSNFYTLKYIKLLISSISLITFTFSIIYFIFIIFFTSDMKNISIINLYLFQTSLWTTELVSIFISLKILYLKKVGKINYDYLNFQSETIINNDDYYLEMEKLSYYLYNNLTYHYGQIEMFIPHYFTESELISLLWDHLNVSYINLNNMEDNLIVDESFPTSIDQFLSNSINFLKKYNISEPKNIQNFDEKKEEYFNYTTYLLIENVYDNIFPNILIKIQKIPKVFSQYNLKKNKTIYIIIIVYLGFMALICIFYFLMIHLTSISMTEILKKMTKIKLERIEETMKKIENFSANLKNFRDRDLINFDEQNHNEIIKDELSPKRSKNYRNSYLDNISLNKTLSSIISDEESSLVGSNGFNTDIKKYYPLTVLTEYLYHCIIFLCLISCFIVPICLYSLTIIININQILLIENYIYGKLISTSLNIIEIKCFISECDTSIQLNYSELQSTENIQEIIKGLKYFEEIDDFYNNRFLLNACDAVINKNKEEKRYELCINDSIIIGANNTENIMKLIENTIDNIYKKDEMNKGKNITLEDGKNITYYRQLIFNDSNFQMIENIFYKYIFSIDDIFEEIVKTNLDEYLKFKKYLLIILVFCFALIMILYNISFLIIFVPKLVYLLNVSRCVLKIIPISVIVNNQELETWIENKY